MPHKPANIVKKTIVTKLTRDPASPHGYKATLEEREFFDSVRVSVKGNSFSFAAVGDIHSDTQEAILVGATVASTKPDFVLFLGDTYSHLNPRATWKRLTGLYRGIESFFGMMGNHDYNAEAPAYFKGKLLHPWSSHLDFAAANRLIEEGSKCGHMAGPYYAIEIDNSKNGRQIGAIIVLDSTTLLHNPAQLEWFRQKLKDYHKRNIPVHVACHHPLVTLGRNRGKGFLSMTDADFYGVDSKNELGYLGLVRDEIVDCVRPYVDIVKGFIAGHDHMLAATQINIDGVQINQIVSGAGGGKPQKITTPPDPLESYAAPECGFQSFQVSADKTEIKTYVPTLSREPMASFTIGHAPRAPLHLELSAVRQQALQKTEQMIKHYRQVVEQLVRSDLSAEHKALYQMFALREKKGYTPYDFHNLALTDPGEALALNRLGDRFLTSPTDGFIEMIENAYRKEFGEEKGQPTWMRLMIRPGRDAIFDTESKWLKYSDTSIRPNPARIEREFTVGYQLRKDIEQDQMHRSSSKRADVLRLAAKVSVSVDYYRPMIEADKRYQELTLAIEKLHVVEKAKALLEKPDYTEAVRIRSYLNYLDKNRSLLGKNRDRAGHHYNRFNDVLRSIWHYFFKPQGKRFVKDAVNQLGSQLAHSGIFSAENKTDHVTAVAYTAQPKKLNKSAMAEKASGVIKKGSQRYFDDAQLAPATSNYGNEENVDDDDSFAPSGHRYF